MFEYTASKTWSSMNCVFMHCMSFETVWRDYKLFFFLSSLCFVCMSPWFPLNGVENHIVSDVFLPWTFVLTFFFSLWKSVTFMLTIKWREKHKWIVSLHRLSLFHLIYFVRNRFRRTKQKQIHSLQSFFIFFFKKLCGH